MRRSALLLIALSALCTLAYGATDATRRDTGAIVIARIDGSINPASSDYLQKAIASAEEKRARLLLIEMDTPGGLVSATQDIIQAMLESNVPIVVYVSPQGAWAGSAGTFITMAAHIAAMAPGSTIGAAHPVGVGGSAPEQEGEDGKPTDHGARKAENMLAAFIKSIAEERGRNVDWAQEAVRDSVAVTAERAVELNVIDLVAKSRSDLLEQLEGRSVSLKSGEEVLVLAGAVTEEVEMELLTQILNVLANPDLAVLLGMAGLLGLYIEMNNPGLIVPGVVGAVCLVLAMIAFQILPFSWTGVIVMLIGMGLLVSEAFFASYGLLFAAGCACLLLGGSMIFDRPELSDLDVSFWPVLVPAVAGMSAFGALVVVAVGRTMGRKQESGVYELIEMEGIARTELDPSGTVFVRGEHWKAHSDERIEADSSIVVTQVDGLTLKVRRAEG